jgi:putative ABC transport system permease protein
MFKNYFKTAIRNLWRFKGFSFINIASLSIGIAGCLVIALFVRDELQYDTFIKGGDDVYRIYDKRTDNIGTTSIACTPPKFATYLKQQYPEVDNTLRILMASGSFLAEAGKTKAYEKNWMITEASFFKFFPLPFKSGDANTALTDPLSIVITEDVAKKYFGTNEAVGKTIQLDKTAYKVTGVLSALPEHFHLSFNMLININDAGIPKERMDSWQWQQFFTYVKVKPGTNIEQLQNKFQQAIIKEVHPTTRQSGSTYLPFFQQLKDIHLQSSDFVYDNAKRGNETYVKGLSIIALFVLVIACFNFINLATARSVRRAKEIGVRKVIGADRKQLIIQFTGETIFMSVIAIVIAAVATKIVIPELNAFTGKSILFNPVTNPLLGLLLLGSGVLIGVLAGIYPAMVLSGFQPVKVLKGLQLKGSSNNNGAWLRQGLVIVQFALSALLIVCATIVYRQINFLHQKDLGFSKDQVMYFDVRGDVTKNPNAFKEELKRSSGVVAVTAGYGLPGDLFAGDDVIVPGKDGEKTYPANQFLVDEDYVTTLGLKIIAGRDFSKQFTTDIDEAFILNETAVRELGFGTPEKAIGQRLAWNKWEPDSLYPVKQGRVIGVVKDFHIKSLHEKVTSTVLQIYPPVLAKVAVKVKTADLPNTIAFIKSAWNKFSPDYPLEYNFLDENYEKMYKAEDKLGSLLWIFTVMAIFVGCMGLFGLAAFSAEQRIKEIGIRKVLGASATGIITMLSKSFLKPVFIASVIAFPIAWILMNKWLENFPYRVTISWWVFAVAAITALIIALITVSFQAVKAALVNPVKSLKSE